ncbi:MAG: GDSL-type esterase/lipase family protein [Planctomycetota bacterium]
MKFLAIAYLVFIHGRCGVMLAKSDFLGKLGKRISGQKRAPVVQSPFHDRTLRLHQRGIESVPDGATIFLGDSLTQGACVSAAAPLAVNYGIASDTTHGVLERLSSYLPAIERASCVVLAIGVNDGAYWSLDRAADHYRQVLDQLPAECPVIASAILPVDDRAEKTSETLTTWRSDFNTRLELLTADYSSVHYVDCAGVLDVDGDGKLDQQFHVGDGIHLNGAGNRAWLAFLRDAISEVKQVPNTH